MARRWRSCCGMRGGVVVQAGAGLVGESFAVAIPGTAGDYGFWIRVTWGSNRFTSAQCRAVVLPELIPNV